MHPLDNVIWHALSTRQSEFAESRGEARRFMPEVSSLAGFHEPSPKNYEAMAELLGPQGAIRLFLDSPFQNCNGWTLAASAPLLQMVWENGCDLQSWKNTPETELVELNAAHLPEMIELTALTQPGPFDKRTHELGTYLGIFRGEKLVAMAGERLKVPGCTELSAVCTHREHTGHGYARVLMTEVMRRIHSRGETPFLHVRGDNLRAIQLYEALGFRRRALRHLAVLRKGAQG